VWDARPVPGGLALSSPEGSAGPSLSRVDVPGGFLLQDGFDIGSREAGRSMRPEPRAGTPDGVTVLLADGRLFRIRSRTGVHVSFELTGWETPGAYWHATRSGSGWDVIRTPAGRDLPAASDVLVLFVAELIGLEGEQG
jgi:hypothetical protein